jgi:hypothetical protein
MPAETAPTPAMPTMDPATGSYHVDAMPLPDDPARRAIVEKQLAGEPLTLGESMQSGRDNTVDMIGEHPVKPDHVYRTVGEAGLNAYLAAGSVVGQEGDQDFVEGENNGGIDWYLGGVALKYGEVVLEAPASPDFFRPSSHAGTGMAKDPRVRHMKSSVAENAVPMSMVNVYTKGPDGQYTKHAQ